MMAQQAARDGHIKGIKLPSIPIFQLMCQYADDTTLFLRGEEPIVNNAIEILEQFCSTSGLLINWSKSAAYWQHRNQPRPRWTSQYQWSWSAPHELSKPLGTPFSLQLSSSSIDTFLVERTRQKLGVWCASRMHISGRAIIANSVILASILFFIVVWTGTV
jgi:hypothetical protein